uniref:receptor protein-tyrosine kinase n=1 Tax=viral metagenome TaxID=1070528 RepID=A0A6C0LBX7_9ZZZZ
MSNPSYYVGIAEPGNVIASSTSTSLSFTGLTGGTAYSMYVIGIYANNTVTSIGTYSFTTTSAVTVLQTSTFAYTGANQTVTVPTGTTYVTAQLWGAGGGGAGNGSNSTYNMTLLGNGGGGGYTTANLTVTAGTTLTVIVGQAGSCSATPGAAITAPYGGGGAALASDSNWRQTSGGGRSAIRISSTEIITAGGGGGGGRMGDSQAPTNVTGYTANGGAGGGLIGDDGGSGDPDTSFQGKGGTQSAGGAAAVNGPSGGTAATAGSQYQGGTSNTYGAAGGGGWYGGGGGNYYSGTNGRQFGAGGGGSSYVSGTYLQAGTSATLTQASRSTVAANASLPAGVQGTIGGGGAGSTTGSAGQNGYVVLTFYSTATTSTVSFTPLLVSGLNLWWDGSDPLNTGTAPANGASLTTWFDKGGNGYNAPASTAATYSSTTKAITFSNSFYTSTYPANPTNESVFIVYNITSANGTVMMIGANTGGREVAMSSNTTFGIVNSGVIWGTTVSGVGTLNQSYLGETFVSGGTNTYASINGSLTLTGPTAVTAFTSGVVTNLGREGTASLPFYGNIMEILIYNSFLPILERQKVEGYLAWKWGIQANLPATHPYYSAKPGGIVYPLTSSWAPAYSNLVAYFMLDETSGSTLVKEQISSYNGTVVGGVTFGSAGIVGNSGTFNGSTGYVSVPYQVLNNLTTGTIMAWVYPTAITAAAICSKQRDGSNTMAIFSIGSAGTGSGVIAGTAGKLYWHGQNTQSPSYVSSTSNLTANKWSHVAVTFGASYVNFYINGVFDSTSAATNAAIPTEATPTLTEIGAWYNNGGMAMPFPGQIDDFSVWNTVLNPSQVFQIYKTQLYGPDTFYLNTSPYLITYYRFETADVNGTSLTNYATNTADATLTSATISSTSGNYKIGSSALALTLQYATINRTFTTAQTFSSGVTFACWFSTPALNGFQRIFDFGVSGTSGIAMFTDSTTGKLGIYIPSTSLGTTLTGTVVTDGVWRHAVWTINTAGLSTVYINGASVLTVSSTFPSLTMTGNYIGKSSFSGDVNFTGKIDDFRVYSTVLTANDVAQLYAYSGSNPTTSYYPLSTTWTPYYGNLLAYYMLDDVVSSTTVKDQINAYTATVVGAVTFGNAGKLSTCAFFNNLSSSTGYLTLPSIPVTSSNMSFSFWANIPSITGNAETFIELGNSSSDHIRIFLSSTNYLVGTINASDSNLFLINPYFNQWIHIVITISAGTNWTVYLNGTSIATVTKTAFTLNTKTLNNIGRSPSYSGNPYYYGYLDDFAIWNTALSAAAVNGIYNTQRLSIYNANLYTVPRQGINFELMFYTSTLPTVDNFGSTLTSTGSPTMVLNANRGNVLSCAASQYITTTINTGTGSFSRCFWYNPQALNNNNTLSSLNCAMWYNNTNFVHVRFNFVSGTALTLIDTVARGTGTWTHYVITYDAILLTGSLYVNGSLISSGSVTFSETGPLVISGYSNGGNSTTSYYDNIHLYNRSITAAEITAMYNYELDNPTDSIALINDVVSTVGLTKRYRFNSGDVVGGRLYNYATGTYDATVYNSPTFSTSLYKVGTSSLAFNGTNQYVNIDAFTLDSTNITITGWFYVPSGGNGWARFFDFGNGAGSNNLLYAPGNGLSVYGSTQTTQPGYGGYNNSAWHFMAWTLTNNGTGNGTWNVYMDNTVIYTNTNAAFPTVISRSNNFLMYSNWAGDGYTTGYLNDFRIYSRILSAGEISALYTYTG